MTCAPTKYPRLIRQNCLPQGVRYRIATSTPNRQMAATTHAMATHRKDSMGAVDQLIDGLNSFGPMVNVSLRSRCPSRFGVATQLQILRRRYPKHLDRLRL